MNLTKETEKKKMDNSKNVKSVVVYHNAEFQNRKAGYVPMASVDMAIEKSTREDRFINDMNAMEYAYRWTNNVMGSWSNKDEVVFENGEQNRDLNQSVTVLKGLKFNDEGRLMGHRSTSVGDVMHVQYVDGSTAWFMVAPFGFKFVNEGDLLNDKLLQDEERYSFIV